MIDWSEMKTAEQVAQDAWEEAFAAVEKSRQVAYAKTSDPLYFEWQRGDATQQEWLDAVQAVKTAHPYPTPPAT